MLRPRPGSWWRRRVESQEARVGDTAGAVLGFALLFAQLIGLAAVIANGKTYLPREESLTFFRRSGSQLAALLMMIMPQDSRSPNLKSS
jgi:hypothetical protein